MRAHLGLELGTQTPQSVHHYCRDHQIQELTALRSDPADGADIGFMNRVLAVCALPRISQGTARNFVRHSGPYTMNLTAMDARFGLPYGTYPRLVFAWMCTEVVRTRNPVLSLGRSFRGFMKHIGVLSSNSGGRSGVRTRLREQMNRLFCSAILLTYQEAGAEWRKGQLIADESHLWWDPKKPDALTLWNSTVEINSKLFLEILAHPVPVDLRVLKAMKRSTLGLDLYLWLAYKTFRMRKPIRLAWRQLYSQFGARPDDVQKNQLDGFRQSSLRELIKLRTAWPELNVEVVFGGLIISQSMPRIQPNETSTTAP